MFIHHMVLNSTHSNDFVMDRKQGMVDYLLLHIKSSCTFIIGGQMYTVTPPSMILVDSYVPHKYFPTNTEYCDDYLHFSISRQKQIMDKLSFPLNVPIFLSNDSAISTILQNIDSEYRKGTKYSDDITTLLLQVLFLKIAEQWDLVQNKNFENAHYQDLLAVHTLIHKNPERNFVIEDLAEMAHLSCSYFQVLYKKTFGLSCITDVIEVKTAHAKMLLSSTNLTVKQIASDLGYHEVYHFIRQFKKNTGMTPLSFRKKCT